MSSLCQKNVDLGAQCAASTITKTKQAAFHGDLCIQRDENTQNTSQTATMVL